MLLCDRSVAVLTGPILGKVTGDTARVLLEVDSAADVTCYFCLVDSSCPQGRPVSAVTRRFAPRRPACFAVGGLLPGERYVCCFSGIRRADAAARTADFKTIMLSAQEVRLLAVSGDRPEAVGPGEFNIWETLHERLRSSDLPAVHLMVHAGGNVFLRQVLVWLRPYPSPALYM